jgi:hypothetical protein
MSNLTAIFVTSTCTSKQLQYMYRLICHMRYMYSSYYAISKPIGTRTMAPISYIFVHVYTPTVHDRGGVVWGGRALITFITYNSGKLSREKKNYKFCDLRATSESFSLHEILSMAHPPIPLIQHSAQCSIPIDP